MRKYFLEIVVFICGAVVMIYEIAGSRVLGPYLGTSIFIWTSLIGIILGSLSLGYWLGGRMADRNPSFTSLAWIIFLSSVLILATNVFKEPFLRLLPRVIPGIRWQSVLSALILFAPASVFLGMVSPYAVRLKLRNLATSGSTVGKLYAISTIGSIAGTFLAGFLLIPLIGTTNILFSLVVIQSLLALLCFFTGRISTRAVIPGIVILFAVYSAFAANLRDKPYVDIDTPYSRVWVYDVTDEGSGKMVRYMRINNESSSAMFLDSDSLVFPYARFYGLAEYFSPGFRSSLMLGGAAFSYPKYFLREFPDASMDVVEIDPELTQIARAHFRLEDSPRLEVYHEDARTFINRMDKGYDVIFGDLFRSQYTLPWHLTTLEAVREYHRLLHEGGSMLVNIIASIQGPGSEFLAAEMATFREVFPYVHVFAVSDPGDLTGIQSMMLVAVKQRPPAVDQTHEKFGEYLANDVTHLMDPGGMILTDEYAPVDYFMGKAIR